MAEREVDDCLVISVLSCVVIVFSQRGKAHILIREDAQGLCAPTFLGLCPHKGEQVGKKGEEQQAKARRPHPETAALSPPARGNQVATSETGDLIGITSGKDHNSGRTTLPQSMQFTPLYSVNESQVDCKSVRQTSLRRALALTIKNIRLQTNSHKLLFDCKLRCCCHKC